MRVTKHYCFLTINIIVSTLSVEQKHLTEDSFCFSLIPFQYHNNVVSKSRAEYEQFNNLSPVEMLYFGEVKNDTEIGADLV